jgi:hypothetical protein
MSNSEEFYTPIEETSYFSLKSDKNKVLLLFLLIIIISWLFFYSKNESMKEKEAATVSNFVEKSLEDSLKLKSLQDDFFKVSFAVDSFTIKNKKINEILFKKQSDLAKLKDSIAVLLNLNNTSISDLEKAKTDIKNIQFKVDSLIIESSKLRAENILFVSEKNRLSKQLSKDNNESQVNLDKIKEEKNRIEDLASTLTTSDITVNVISKKGDKEKETPLAKRADYFKLSLIINENRVSQTGKKEIYVVIIKPDSTVAVSNGTFTDRNGQNKKYTEKVEVKYEQGKRQVMSFNWVPVGDLMLGKYKIEFYQNGFKIGECDKTLK